MKNFWALPAFLRVAIATQQQAFNVNDDFYTFPQYEIIYRRDAPVTHGFANEKLHPDFETADSASQELSQPRSPTSRDTSSIQSRIAGWESLVKQGQRYLCSIPVIPPVIPAAPSNKTAEEEANELSVVVDRGQELLKGMEGHCIYYISGWWSYSFCYNEGVRQFHPLPMGRNVPALPPVEDENVGAYILGRFKGKEQEPREEDDTEYDDEGNAKKKRRVLKKVEETQVAKLELKGQKGSTRYLVQTLKGGTICDLTGEERSIEVQFRCDNFPTDRIAIIKETSICQYRMVINTPRLCNDIAFQPPKGPKPHPISCHPVMGEEAITDYIDAQEALEAEAEAEQEDIVNDAYEGLLHDIKAALGLPTDGKDGETQELDTHLKKRTPIVRVGDIVVGGHNIVPKDLTLERGVVVGGVGKEKVLATIAKSDGYTATEKELAKLSITGGKELESIKDKVKKAAAGEDWQIDVVETALGKKELRGMIGSKESKAKKENKKAKENKAKANEQKEAKQQQKEEEEEEEQPLVEEEEGSEETYKEEL